MIKVDLPVTEEKIRELKAGDVVLISGRMITARDTGHKYLVENDDREIAAYLDGSVIYHLGPVVEKTEDGWKMVAAGPTTSAREEPYEAEVIERYGVKGVIGKGGMGQRTLDALGKFGAVYFHAIGGAATLLASAVKDIPGVFKLEEFGVPEAFWVLDVEDFPAVVTMDSHGTSLHREVEELSEKNLLELLED